MKEKNLSNLNKVLAIRLLAIVALGTLSVGGLLLYGPAIGNLFGMISVNRGTQIKPPEAATPPPVFIDLPSATNKTSLNIKGVSVPKASVELYVNGPKIATVLADMTGEFLFTDITLIKGKNTLFVKANETKSDTVSIQFDNKNPKLEISSPKDGQTVENLNERVEIRGQVDKRAEIRINGLLAIQKPDNSFSFLLGVKEGTVKIKVEATDLAGNKTTEEVSVVYKKK